MRQDLHVERGAWLLGIKKILLAFVLLFTFWLMPGFVHAGESLTFVQQVPALSQKKLKKFLGVDNKMLFHDLKIARADLNGDGADEFILKSKVCDILTKNCSYKILAETNSGIIEIGNIKGKTLLLGNDYSSGIRNLLVFNNQGSNDYDYQRYIWDTKSTRYTIEE